MKALSLVNFAVIAISALAIIVFGVRTGWIEMGSDWSLTSTMLVPYLIIAAGVGCGIWLKGTWVFQALLLPAVILACAGAASLYVDMFLSPPDAQGVLAVGVALAGQTVVMVVGFVVATSATVVHRFVLRRRARRSVSDRLVGAEGLESSTP